MAEAVNEAELGRSKQSATPVEHLKHLLNLGWEPSSPLIQRYARDNQLQKDLEEWTKKKKS